MITAEQARTLGPSRQEVMAEQMRVLTQLAPQVFADLLLEHVLGPKIAATAKTVRFCELQMMSLLFHKTFRAEFDSALPAHPLGASYFVLFMGNWWYPRHDFQEVALQMTLAKLRSDAYGFKAHYVNIVGDAGDRCESPPMFDLTPAVQNGIITIEVARQIMVFGTTEGVPPGTLDKLSCKQAFGEILYARQFKQWTLNVLWT